MPLADSEICGEICRSHSAVQDKLRTDVVIHSSDELSREASAASKRGRFPAAIFARQEVST
jgi:hypothetical protein